MKHMCQFNLLSLFINNKICIESPSISIMYNIYKENCVSYMTSSLPPSKLPNQLINQIYNVAGQQSHKEAMPKTAESLSYVL